ncbi:MAG: hypothetical protein V4581_08970 [Bacteroidota bacterium]
MKKIFILSLLIFSSCQTNCVAVAEIYRDYKCKLVVEKLNDSNSAYNFDVSGISLETNADTIYKQENRWFCSYYKYIQKGDTIIKRKGELIFNIHKKDTVFRFDWKCEGKVYK